LSVRHFQVKQIPQNSGNHSLAEPAKTSQQSGDGHDTGPKAAAWHCGRQLSPTSLSAVRTPERVNLMFCDNRLNWGEVRNLMTLRIRIVAAESETAICAHRRAMMHHVITCFCRNQGTSRFRCPD
jgi:hypothetical protein